MERFQQALIEQRKLNKLTQRQIANALGISQPSYIRYEKGQAEPTLENLVKLADLFEKQHFHSHLLWILQNKAYISFPHLQYCILPILIVKV